jgi:hypothetical protein
MDFQLTESGKLWIRELIRRRENAEERDPVAMRILLRDRLDDEFNSQELEHGYVRDGNPTALAEYLVDPSGQTMSDLHRLIVLLREKIVEAPNNRSFTAASLASDLKLPMRQLQRALQALTSLGAFTSGWQSDISGTISEVSLNSELGIARLFKYTTIESAIEQVYAPPPASPIAYGGPPGSGGNVDRGTAFILMHMDPAKLELLDVCDAIKEVCRDFGIDAQRADDIEHQVQITNVILNRIKRAEYLIADLSGERPNVYYEIGYAHALHKNPILFRRKDTAIHFDLSLHNVPAYENMRDLKRLLTRRFEAILGRKAVRSTQ